MQQKSLKNRLVLIILFLFPVTNLLSVYRFYAGKVFLGIVRIILIIAYFVNVKSVIAPYAIGLWAIITLFDFILVVIGKFKDKNGLCISSFKPEKGYEEFLEEKRKAEEAEEEIKKQKTEEERRIKEEQKKEQERMQKEEAEKKEFEKKKEREEKIATVLKLKEARNEKIKKLKKDYHIDSEDINEPDDSMWKKYFEEVTNVHKMYNSSFDYLEDNPFLHR